MNLELIKSAVTSKVGRSILIGEKHSPTIMFVGGVAGMVGATVLACRATLKVDEILTEAEEKREMARTLIHRDYSEMDRTRDYTLIKVKAGGKLLKLYAPAIGLGVVSIALLTKSHVVLTKRNAAVMAAYAALEKGFDQYRARVREELGEEKDREFRYGTKTLVETMQTETGSELVEHKVLNPTDRSIYARIFDDTSKEWCREPEYNRFFLHSQQSFMNDLLVARGHVFLNDVYDRLGLPRSSAGSVVGWVLNKEGDNFIDFGIFDIGEGWAGERKRAFINGHEASILLDFNVDGMIWDKI